MKALGFERFAVAGHDRGPRVAHRLARDPLLVLWGERRSQGSGYDVLGMWHEHAETVSGHAIKSGHFLPEEAPEDTYRALRGFFAEPCDALVDPPVGSALSQPNTKRRLSDPVVSASSKFFVIRLFRDSNSLIR